MPNSDTYQFVVNQVNSLKSDSDSAVQDLITAAMGYLNPALSQAGMDNNPDWSVDRGREFALSGVNNLPADAPTLDIPPFVFNPEDYINADLLQRYSYDSAFFDDFLEDKLITFINAQSYFINESVQDALFEQTRERDLQILNDQLDAVDRVEARTGFPLMSSIHEAARNEVIKQYGDRRSDRNSEITALIAERAHDGVKHSVDAGIKMEDIRSRFQLEYGRLYWQAADYLIKKYESDIRAAIAEFEGQLGLIKANTDVDAKLADFDLEYEKLDQAKELERFRGHVEEMRAYIDAWKVSFDGRIKAAMAAVDYYANAVASANGILNDVTTVDETA